MKARDVMAAPVSCGEDARLGTVAQLMIDRAVRMVVVCDGQGRVCGVVTDRDLCRVLAGAERPVQSLAAREAMTAEAITVAADDAVQTVLDVMAEHGLSRVPVVDGSRVPVGVAAIDDLARLLARDAVLVERGEKRAMALRWGVLGRALGAAAVHRSGPFGP